jgi:cell division protein FtsB
MGNGIALLVGASDYAIPLGALILSAAALAFTALGMRSKASGTYVSDLERRVKECEDGRAQLKRRLGELEDENINLMRRVMKLENGS